MPPPPGTTTVTPNPPSRSAVQAWKFSAQALDADEHAALSLYDVGM
jgi:hypothetical protein